MLNQQGQIAVLYQNKKQVGGIRDWDCRVILNYTTRDGIKEYQPVKHIDAQSYWILEPIEDNEFNAEFYQVLNNELVLMDAGRVVIDFPDVRTLGRRLYAPIEVRWIGDNEH